MAYEIEIYGSLCATSKFTINGIDGESSDFGDQFDHDQEGAEDYCCGNMAFDPKSPTDEVLKKYSIDELEYWSIANDLSEKLSFGNCGWCS